MANRCTLERLASLSLPEVAALPLAEISMLLEDVSAEKAQTKMLEGLLTDELDRRFGDAAQATRKALGKDAGTVTVTTAEGHKVRADKPKKVEWSQPELAKAVETIRSWGEDPRDYVAIEVKVAEAKYTAWPPAIRKLFEPARVVGVGRPSYKLELAKEAA